MRAFGRSRGTSWPRASVRRMPHSSQLGYLVAILLAAAAGTLVFFHAERNRIGHSSAWASFVFLFLIVGLPSYVLRVRRVRWTRGAS
jgi:high-affinity Fe2+/Pb2+ permease